ncbi:MAG: hypothetical protein ACT6S0_03865 [Roseateles sp.]|uniref:hypothetical protein n=1 Tax=Roseateles sp. TaxID=1971397 RepID=UPI004035E2A0
MHWTEALLKDPVGAGLLDNMRSPSFIISPGDFHRADITPRMNWNSVKFEASQQANLPTDPGLYAFVIRVGFPGLPPNGWVLYIGQTGDGASRGTLRARFGQYLKDKKKPKRLSIFLMLNAWDGALEFFYAPLPGRKADLVKLETELLGAFRPPFTDRTYPAAYMSPRHAF